MLWLATRVGVVPYYMASCIWVGKMNQILHCDWLLKWARWSYLACSGLPAVSHKKNFPKSQIINPLLTKLVWSRWLYIGLILFFARLWVRVCVSVHKHAKKELGQKLKLTPSWHHAWLPLTSVCLGDTSLVLRDFTVWCANYNGHSNLI